MMKRFEVSRLYFIAVHALLAVSLIFASFWWLGKPPVAGAMAREGAPFATIGHRGASGYAPECTLASYRLAHRMNVDYLELDLHLTADGEIVVMHDDTVNRTTNGSGSISRMTLAEIKSLDAGSWFNEKYPMYAREEYRGEQVPALREIFDAFGDRTNYLLETKAPDETPGLEEKMWALVQAYGLEDHVAVQSFSKKSLKKIREWSPTVPLFQLLWYNHPSTISRDRLNDIRQYANGIGANFGKINEAYVRKVQSAGLKIFPYTVNYQVNMDSALRWGVDGIHTDYPDRFKEMVDHYAETYEEAKS